MQINYEKLIGIITDLGEKIAFILIIWRLSVFLFVYFKFR